MPGGSILRQRQRLDIFGNTSCVARARRCAQETPDPPEALTCMPSLQLSDIPKRAATIPTEISEARAGGHLSGVLKQHMALRTRETIGTVVWAGRPVDIRASSECVFTESGNTLPLGCRYMQLSYCGRAIGV